MQIAFGLLLGANQRAPRAILPWSFRVAERSWLFFRSLKPRISGHLGLKAGRVQLLQRYTFSPLCTGNEAGKPRASL